MRRLGNRLERQAWQHLRHLDGLQGITLATDAKHQEQRLFRGHTRAPLDHELAHQTLNRETPLRQASFAIDELSQVAVGLRSGVSRFKV